MSILLGVIVLFAILSATLAGMQAIAINRLAPAGEWRGWVLGWWRFDEIAQRAGLGGEENAAIYKRAVIATVIFVVFGLVLSGWTLQQRPQGAAHIGQYTFDGGQNDIAAVTNNAIFRPVAPTPGATFVES
ncbi:MAG: hypothetical protein KIT02_03830 [Devosia sp.]|uniref:hypothetical protein n=1 Tax=Devosia sp. TaxID=1871048 RepID=UPI0024CBE3F8|nr:hypothetical protein [Devosia sp.]UYO00360.1 MAG: hypothetical protein KIT02_03830 [Devosia sp.]